MKLGLGHFVDRAMYRDYLRRLDVRAVLEHYGVDNDRDESGADGTTEVIHSCLIDRVEPHHAHGDANPSAAANLEKKLYICYGHWSGDLIQLIMKMEGKTTVESITGVLAQFLGEAVTDREDFPGELDALLAPAAPARREITAYSDRILDSWNTLHPYLAERGIDDATATRLRLGWDAEENRITIPHFWRGELVGWQKRAVPDRPGCWPGTAQPVPKYRSSPGFPKSSTLYGFDRVTAGHRIVVVESPFSVIKAEALGVSGVVATFGAAVSTRQIGLLSDVDHVVVWMDPDTAGRAAERRVVRALEPLVRTDLVTPDEGCDLGDCTTAEQIESKIDAARPAWAVLAEWDKEA